MMRYDLSGQTNKKQLYKLSGRADQVFDRMNNWHGYVNNDSLH